MVSSNSIRLTLSLAVFTFFLACKKSCINNVVGYVNFTYYNVQIPPEQFVGAVLFVAFQVNYEL